MRANALLTQLRYTGCSAPLLELTGAASRFRIIAAGASALLNGYESWAEITTKCSASRGMPAMTT